MRICSYFFHLEAVPLKLLFGQPKSQRFFFSLILFNLREMPVSRYNLQTLFSGSPTAHAPSLRRRNPGTCTSTSTSKCRHLIENVVYRLFVELGISHDSKMDSA